MTKSMAFMLRLLTQITTWLTAQLARIRDWFFRRREHVEPKPITRAERRRRMRARARILTAGLRATKQPRYQRRRIAWQEAKKRESA